MSGLFVGSVVYAQQPAGKISEIKDVSETPPVKLTGVTPKVKIRRSNISDWVNAQKGLRVFQGDFLQVSRLTRVKLKIKYNGQKGTFILLPDTPDAPKKNAIFRIGEKIDRIKGMKLFLLKGTMIADWAHGKLSVIANGIRSIFLGTKVLYVVDEGKNSSYMFVQKGTIRFPDYPEVIARAQEVYQLRENTPPKKIIINSPRLKKLNEFSNFNSHTIWSSGKIWTKPYFYIPAAAVITGSIVFLATRGGNEKITSIPRGTVRISFP